MLDALQHGKMSHNSNKSPTTHMNFYCLYMEKLHRWEMLFITQSELRT